MAQDGSSMLQIDGSYQNLHQRSKGSATTTTIYFPLAGANVSYVAVQFGGGFNRRPLVAVRSGSLVAMGNPQQNPDGSWWAYFYVRADVGATFDWYAYDTLAPAERGTYGLQVMNAAGEVVFDSTWRAMRVVGIVSNDGISGVTYSLPAGRTYAVAMNPGGRAIPTGPSAGVVQSFGASVSSGTITVSPFQVATIAGAVSAANGPVAGIILDVTNY
ncbi:hypothetical protein ARC20_03120 [Stenotrophomonas panacihumi]|uniref:Uncharacterized protein n=2 Tax=Stenotrophomonas panacihumi TaxID=676599 RepID=A0A0R0B0E4_9GAMM|nr:hypothetical protein ARC20_03120 [Stenotrophomonas panacihumi]PTN55812.1 hypothetical protein C9J98_04360 [Stenotrophomonas panacihumi]